MNDEGMLHFFSGKMAAGKSTLARKLAEESNAILIVEDEWLARLFPEEIATIADYRKCAQRLQSVTSDHVVSLLMHGVSVVMDFPGNTLEQRGWFRTLFEKAGSAHTLHFINLSDAACKRQLKKRSEGRPDGAPFTSEAEFDVITRYFQPPSESEGFNIVTYER